MDIVQRAKAIVLKPATEWPIIERESGEASYLFINYAAALAAIPAAFLFLRSLFSGGGFAASLVMGCVHWVVALAFAFVLALGIENFGPTIGIEKNRPAALKLVVYALTPVWVAGVLALLPGFGFLRIVAAAYGVYLFYVGVPVLLPSTTSERTVRLTAVVALGGIAVWAVVSAVIGTFL